MRRVVVTGIGLVTPLGLDVKSSWEALLAGRSGIGPIERFDASAFGSRIAGEVKGFDATKVLPPKEARRFERYTAYGIAAATEAMQDAGLAFTGEESDSERAGVLIGSGIGGLDTKCRDFVSFLEQGPRRITPFVVPASIINSVSGQLSVLLHMKGPNFAVASACTTGLHAIGEASWIIARDDADIMLAGGTESPIHPLGLGGFDNIHALSRRNEMPQEASSPFDLSRDGFVLAEGAGVLVLEEYEHARARGAHIYCEIAGYGLCSDAYHFTAPSQEGAERCMRLALKRAKMDAQSVDFLLAHGTSTPMGDTSEAKAIRAVFGSKADTLVVTSTKGAMGHALGGAGGIEAAFTALSLEHQVAPATLNLREQDSQCPIHVCANTARDMAMRVAMKNNFGFGGTNASVILKRL